ncbi:MAG: hypothetical protein RR795_01645 [Cetobacterium sp.]|uniref:hypothetical protein n=1 Tax=Cetobacterium sp. TaxID=2071632 RepID=UPI002FCB2897
MRYRIENYIAVKLHNIQEELEEVVDGNGVIEYEDLEYSNGFLVYNKTNKKIEYKYFNPNLYEKWDGTAIVEDASRKLQDEKFAEERKKDSEFKNFGRIKVQYIEEDVVLTQEALNFIIFGTQARTKSLDVDIKGMSAYLANQIIKKHKISKEKGIEFYNASIVKYPEMQNEIDNILKNEGGYSEKE